MCIPCLSRQLSVTEKMAEKIASMKMRAKGLLLEGVRGSCRAVRSSRAAQKMWEGVSPILSRLLVRIERAIMYAVVVSPTEPGERRKSWHEGGLLYLGILLVYMKVPINVLLVVS